MSLATAVESLPLSETNSTGPAVGVNVLVDVAGDTPLTTTLIGNGRAQRRPPSLPTCTVSCCRPELGADLGSAEVAVVGDFHATDVDPGGGAQRRWRAEVGAEDREVAAMAVLAAGDRAGQCIGVA